MLAIGVLLLGAPAALANPPAVIDVWIDAERLLGAASVFERTEHEWFASELTRVSGPDRYWMFPPPAPLVGLRATHELNAAIIGLICPSLRRGDVPTIERFLTRVNTQRLVRGRGNYEGWTVVSYHLQRPGRGEPWRLEARHRNVAGPEDQAPALRKQTAPSFSTYVDCAGMEQR